MIKVKRVVMYPVLLMTGLIVGGGVVYHETSKVTQEVVNEVHESIYYNAGDLGYRVLLSLDNSERDELADELITDSYENDIRVQALYDIQKPFFEYQLKNRLFDIDMQ